MKTDDRHTDENTKEKITLGSLFDGLGGWQIAAVKNGITPIWSSEVDPQCCLVTRTHFPDTVQLGDIRKIEAWRVPPVDILTFGSPCQNLSIAGNRKGFQGDASWLFWEAIRIIFEMRKRTHAQYPKITIWENVVGAFSSNGGKDFQAVLSAFMETKIPVPASGRWAAAGMVGSRTRTLAWRVLDAQYWGVPQRRKRIFLVCDFRTGRLCRPEILFDTACLRGDSKAGPKGRKGTAPKARQSTEESMVLNDQGGKYMNISRNVVGTLRANSRSHEPILYDISHREDGIRTVGDISTTLTAHMGTGGNNVPIVQENETVGSLCADMAKGINNQYVGQNQVQTDERGVRRLTPLECERLQGLPDGWTDVGISDSARYRMIGNGMAQPCADYVLEKAAQALQKKNISPKKNS